MNTNLPPILHRFRDIASIRSKIAVFGYPLAFKTSRQRGFPRTIFVKFSVDVSGCQGTKWRRNIAEIFNRFTRVHERYRRQTDVWIVNFQSVPRYLLKFSNAAWINLYTKWRLLLMTKLENDVIECWCCNSILSSTFDGLHLNLPDDSSFTRAQQ